VTADVRIADADLRARLGEHLMHARAHGLTIARAHAEARGDASPSNAVSMLKASATIIAQTRAELILEILGTAGLGWGGDDFTREELKAVRAWLGGKAISIAGGSFEIQQNIIAKRILGLPEPAPST
jgi:alkylation response protein AidB-like acyl-CoA dehydrogenase